MINLLLMAATNESKMPDDQNRTTAQNAARKVSRRAWLMALLALPFIAIAEPQPAAAQFSGFAHALGAVFGGGHRYHYSGRHGRHYGASRHHTGRSRHAYHPRSRAASHRRAGPATAHRSRGGGGHHAGGGGGGGSGPGGGSFH